jgi:hypothetical protein
MSKSEVKEYMFQWLDKKHGGSPSIDEWNPEEVIQFAHDYAQSVQSGSREREILNEVADALVAIRKDKDWENAEYILQQLMLAK